MLTREMKKDGVSHGEGVFPAADRTKSRARVVVKSEAERVVLCAVGLFGSG